MGYRNKRRFERLASGIYSRHFGVEFEGKSQAAAEVLILKRFTVPEPKEVASYLREKIQRVQALRGKREGNKSALEDALIVVPGEILDDFANKTNDEEFVIEHMTVLMEGVYLSIREGIMPSPRRELYDDRDNLAAYCNKKMEDPELAKAGWGKLVSVRFRLDKGMLPRRKDINVLVRNRTYDSGTFYVEELRCEYSRILPIVDWVYSKYDSEDSIRNVPDVSRNAIEEIAMVPIRGLHQRIIDAHEREKALTRELMDNTHLGKA